MKIIFRVDASVLIGSGHVMRCFALAKGFQKQGYEIVFLSRNISSGLQNILLVNDIELKLLKKSEDKDDKYKHSAWLEGSEINDAIQFVETINKYKYSPKLIVVDHYALAAPWEKLVKNIAPILVIDDLNDRPHDANWLLDQSLGKGINDYINLISYNTKTMFGPNYALLREEFSELREKALKQRVNTELPQNILITLGGVDKNNISELVLNALNITKHNFCITLIAGIDNSHYSKLKKQSLMLKHSVRLVQHTQSIGYEMLNADICIGAAGSSSWERCVLGLPTVNLVLADNQYNISKSLGTAGAAIDFGYLKEEKDILKLQIIIDELADNREKYSLMCERSFAICDGLGVKRVVKRVLG